MHVVISNAIEEHAMLVQHGEHLMLVIRKGAIAAPVVAVLRCLLRPVKGTLDLPDGTLVDGA